MRQVLFLAAKDIRLLLRDRPSFFFTFFWPVMMAVFFGTIFSGGGAEDAAIRVAWVDEDASAGSVAFAETLAARGQVVPVPASRSEAEDMVLREMPLPTRCSARLQMRFRVRTDGSC